MLGVVIADNIPLKPDHAVTADIIQSVSVQKYIFTETQHIPVVKKIMPLLAAVWFIGAALSNLVCLYKYFALKHFVDRWATDNGVYKCGNKSLKVKKCPGISSPMLMGVFAPVIIFFLTISQLIIMMWYVCTKNFTILITIYS